MGKKKGDPVSLLYRVVSGPTQGDQYVSVNGWREAGESDGGYGVFLPLPFGNGEWLC